MPFPNFHAFRVKNPDLFKPSSFRTMDFKHNNKPYSVIMGQLKGEDTMTAQTYRYPKKYWTAAQAKAHGMNHDKTGMFEAAKGDSIDTERTDTLDVSRASFCRLDSTWTKNDEGYIDALVYPTRIGVFPYFDSKQNKIVYELRSPEEVFKADSLKSLEGKDLTNNHPSDMVKSSSFKALSVGSLYGPHTKADDGIHTQSRAMVKEDGAIAAVEGGKNQVSCGYKCDLINQAGTWEGQHYDRQQVNIKYNHLALVDRGRMGPEARLRADAAFEDGTRFDAYEVELEQEQESEIEMPDMENMTPEEIKKCIAEMQAYLKDSNKTKVGNKKTMKIDGREFTCDEVGEVLIENKFKADAEIIKAEKERADKAESEAAKLKTDMATLQAAHDVLKADLEKAQKIDMAQLVKDRVALIATANKIAKNDKYDSMTDSEIKKAAVKSVYDWADFVKNDSDSYLQGLFEAASKTKKDGESVIGAYDDARTFDDASFSRGESKLDWDVDPLAA